MNVVDTAIAFISRSGRLAVSRALSTLFQSLVVILVARGSDIADYGLYSTGIAVGMVAASTLGFGLPTRVLRLEADGRSYLSPSVMAISAVSSMAVLGIVIIVGVAFQSSVTWIFIAAGLFGSSELITNVSFSLLFNESKIGRAELGILGRRLIPFFSVAIGTLVFKWNIYASVSAGYLGVITFAFILQSKRPWPGWNLGMILRSSSQYWRTNIWSVLQQADVLIISGFIGASSAGAYAASFRLASPVHIVTTSLVSIYTPILSNERDDRVRWVKGAQLRKIGMVYAAALILAAPVTTVVGPLLFGSEFQPTRWLFPMMFVNSAMSVMNQLLAATLVAENQPSKIANATRIATLFGLGVVIIGSLWSSVYMAASGTVLIQLILVFLLWLGRPDRYLRKDVAIA